MLLRRLLYATLGLVMAGGIALATVPSFQPGYALQDGSALNLLVNAINGTGGGTFGNIIVGGAANQISLTGGATTVGPRISVGGTASDTNIGIQLSGKGSGAAHLGGTTLSNASVRAPTIASAVNQVQLEGSITGSPILVHPGGSLVDTNAGVDLYGNGTGAVLLGGNTTTLAGLQVAQTASRVNDFVLTPSATGNTPGFLAGGAGSDATLGVAFGTQGTGGVAINTSNTLQQFGVTNTASAVDWLSCTGGATANPALVTCTATGSDTNVNIVLASKAAGNVKLGTSSVSTCSGTTTATCQGQRFVVSITGLTTAASTLSAAMTVTNANVVSNASTVMCQVNLYGGTGVPIAVNVTPGTGTVALNIQNVATAAALNATVPVACVVFGT